MNDRSENRSRRHASPELGQEMRTAALALVRQTRPPQRTLDASDGAAAVPASRRNASEALSLDGMLVWALIAALTGIGMADAILRTAM